MAGIMDLFIPREKKFFQLLNQKIEILEDCSGKLSKILKAKKPDPKDYLFVVAKSDKADKLSQEIVNSLHLTFITPIDREEIISLSNSITFIINSIEKLCSSILYFKIKKLDKHFLEQVNLLLESIKVLKKIFETPLSKENRAHIQKIKALEMEGDALFRKSLIYLFGNGHNAIEVIKQKELYEIAEDAIDDAKHIADVMESVLVNNS